MCSVSANNEKHEEKSRPRKAWNTVSDNQGLPSTTVDAPPFSPDVAASNRKGQALPPSKHLRRSVERQPAAHKNYK